MDRTDRRILAALQRRADLPMHQLGESVGLSQTQCWRRIKRLEKAGVIRRRVALLDPRHLRLTANVFVELELDRPADARVFADVVQEFPEIVECYMVSGDTDFLLRMVAPDVPAYDRLLQAMLERLRKVHNVKTTFALREIKHTTELPIR